MDLDEDGQGSDEADAISPGRKMRGQNSGIPNLSN